MPPMTHSQPEHQSTDSADERSEGAAPRSEKHDDDHTKSFSLDKDVKSFHKAEDDRWGK